MEVVKIQQMQMLCSSPGAKSLVSDEGFNLTGDWTKTTTNIYCFTRLSSASS